MAGTGNRNASSKAASKRKEVASKFVFHCFLFHIFKILTVLREVRQSKMQNSYHIKPHWILQAGWMEDVRRKCQAQEPPLPDVPREEKVILSSKIPLIFLIFCSFHSFPYKLLAASVSWPKPLILHGRRIRSSQGQVQDDMTDWRTEFLIHWDL